MVKQKKEVCRNHNRDEKSFLHFTFPFSFLKMERESERERENINEKHFIIFHTCAQLDMITR